MQHRPSPTPAQAAHLEILISAPSASSMCARYMAPLKQSSLKRGSQLTVRMRTNSRSLRVSSRSMRELSWETWMARAAPRARLLRPAGEAPQTFETYAQAGLNLQACLVLCRLSWCGPHCGGVEQSTAESSPGKAVYDARPPPRPQ